MADTNVHGIWNPSRLSRCIQPLDPQLAILGGAGIEDAGSEKLAGHPSDRNPPARRYWSRRTLGGMRKQTCSSFLNSFVSLFLNSFLSSFLNPFLGGH